MSQFKTIATIGMVFTAPAALAVVDVGIPVLSAEMGRAAGGALPFSLGGMAAIAALSLIIGAQLIKGRKK